MRPGRDRPGDPSSPEMGVGDMACFNEAGAGSPRRHGAGHKQADGEHASMRPGRDRPGEPSTARMRSLQAMPASMRPGRDRPGERPACRPLFSCANPVALRGVRSNSLHSGESCQDHGASIVKEPCISGRYSISRAGPDSATIRALAGSAAPGIPFTSTAHSVAQRQ